MLWAPDGRIGRVGVRTTPSPLGGRPSVGLRRSVREGPHTMAKPPDRRQSCTVGSLFDAKRMRRLWDMATQDSPKERLRAPWAPEPWTEGTTHSCPQSTPAGGPSSMVKRSMTGRSGRVRGCGRRSPVAGHQAWRGVPSSRSRLMLGRHFQDMRAADPSPVG